MGRAELAGSSGVGASFVVGAILPRVVARIVGLAVFRRPS
jgi:hypothetical protein